MHFSGRPAIHVLHEVATFAGRTLRDFSHNQGLLLAGAVAYYALLSVVPLLILSVVALSHVVSRAELLNMLAHYLDWLVPGQSQTVLADVADFLENRIAIGAVLSATIVFFSSLAFSVLEKAMAVIFAHRHAVQRRHFLVSAILPYCFVLLLCVAMLGVTLISVALQTMAQESVHWAGREWSLQGLSGVLVYLVGLVAEASILTTLYLVLPVGRTRLHHALAGGLVATALWEVLRHLLVWYFTTLSKANIVYGSLSTAVVTLVSMEIAATLFLLGAQVIAEYERSAPPEKPAPAPP